MFDRGTKEAVTLKELETFYSGPFDVLGEWVARVLHVFVEAPSPRLAALDRRYSCALESEEVQMRFDLDRPTCEQLRGLFYDRCQRAAAQRSLDGVVTQPTHAKAELSEAAWVEWTVASGYLASHLAQVVFAAQNTRLKSAWCFGDFAGFCMTHGAASVEHQVDALCEAFLAAGRVKTVPAALWEMVRALAAAAEKQPSGCQGPHESADARTLEDESSDEAVSPVLAAAVRSLLGAPSGVGNSDAAAGDDAKLITAAKQLTVRYASSLPGLRDLAITASCLFGLQPAAPRSENEFITELTLRYMRRARVEEGHPFGPLNTEWCLVQKGWYDRWRVYVGTSGQNALRSSGETNSGSKRYPPKPGAIDNWSIAHKQGARGQLLPGLVAGVDFELVAPEVYSALHMWYGGGLRISRRVVASAAGSDSGGGTTEMEYYPLCVKVATCDGQGRTSPQGPHEMLLSRTATVADVVAQLCQDRSGVRPGQVRLWNYAREHWKDQFVLAPEVTLHEAGICDGQTLLMEVSLPNGTWPRSQLHTALQERDGAAESVSESSKAGEPVVAVDGHDPESRGEEERRVGLVARPRRRASKGLVGLDNLGNTCYLNSSLQALLHTDLLVDYFLSQAYLRDINVKNVHGFKGRLAHSFGRLVSELYGAEKKQCVSPRHLLQTIAALRDQFAGNDQHDAHELLAFLLDGLSEDLNLVHHKPYIEQPDSEGRPEAEVADIWWRNHLLRDQSIVQALFTGQFQSLMRCTCGYASARYEPFTCLTVPIPEESHRVMTVVVVPLRLEHTVRVSVRVPKTALLEEVAQQVRALNLAGTGNLRDGDGAVHFLAGELHGGRIRSFNSFERRVDSIRDNDNIAFFQVRTLPGQPTNPGASAVATDFYSEHAEAVAEEFTDRIVESLSVNQGPPSHVTERLEYAATHKVRVAFTQRRAKLVSGAALGAAGYDLFRPEPVGMTVLEVLPENMGAGDLYAAVAERMRAFLRAPVEELLSSRALQTAPFGAAAVLPMSAKEIPSSASGRERVEIRSVETDEVMGGAAIPSTGFTLRFVCGGASAGGACSKCPWLSRCQGCVVPNSNDVVLSLCDGECLAVDWHSVVFEEVVDVDALLHVENHPSVMAERASASENRVPLSRCLDKFTEREHLDGVTCPSCKRSDHMSKSFTVWRQPPILIVQIKRFQFDSVARRKLYTAVDFPLDGLDVAAYMAPARIGGAEGSPPGPPAEDADDPSVTVAPEEAEARESAAVDAATATATASLAAATAEATGAPETTSEVGLDEGAKSDASPDPPAVGEPSRDPAADAPPGPPSDCTEYDLYCAIHHQGALGGGHYITAVRDRSALTVDGQPAPDQWHCYNDHMVSPVRDTAEICSSSAYLLFYARRDVLHARYSDLLLAGANSDSSEPVLLQSPPLFPSKAGGGGGDGTGVAVAPSSDNYILSAMGRGQRALGKLTASALPQPVLSRKDLVGGVHRPPAVTAGAARPTATRPVRSGREDDDQNCTVS